MIELVNDGGEIPLINCRKSRSDGSGGSAEEDVRVPRRRWTDWTDVDDVDDVATRALRQLSITNGAPRSPKNLKES